MTVYSSGHGPDWMPVFVFHGCRVGEKTVWGGGEREYLLKEKLMGKNAV